MKCNKCGAELTKKDKVCPSCGEKVNKIGYFNFIKRREQRYIETQELLQKSYVKADDAKSSQLKELGGIAVEFVGDYTKVMRIALIKVILFSLLLAGSVVLIALKQYTSLMNAVNNIGMTVILLIAFLLIFGSLAMLYDTAYYAVRCRKMKNNKEDIAKINFGKEPTAYYAGRLYKVSLKISCPMCSQSSDMHIEQVDDMFVAVCNYDRCHMLRLSKAEALNAVKEYEFGRSGLEYTPTPEDNDAGADTAEDTSASAADIADSSSNAESNADISDIGGADNSGDNNI